MSKFSTKEEFVSALKNRGYDSKDLEGLWEEFQSLSTKMANCRKNYTFTLEECFVIIESLYVSQISGIGTKIGSELINKLSEFFFENELNPPTAQSVSDTLDRSALELSKEIESVFSSMSKQQNEFDDYTLFPRKKKEKTYLN
jgi:hypothetical protein